jgi:hypothetical protein
MKKNIRYRFVSVVSLAAFVALVIVTVGWVAGPARNVNIAEIPGQVPAQTEPVNVERSAFDRAKESYRVYSAILDHGWNKGSIAIRDHTDPGLFQNDEWRETTAGKTYPEAVSDFKTVNEKDTQIENHFDYSGKISLIDQQEFKSTIGGGDGWESFRKNNPGFSGIVTLSAVGFDRNGSHALVNVSYLCGNRCGNGNFYILETRDGKWVISQEVGTLIS